MDRPPWERVPSDELVELVAELERLGLDVTSTPCEPSAEDVLDDPHAHKARD